MKIGQRLFLAVLPAILGLFLVAALGYWGRYAETVPELVLVIAAVAAVLSLVFAWRNARYVVTRIERLALTPGTSELSARTALHDLGLGDELDAIEATVAGLSSAVATSREESARVAREASDRERQFEGLLDEVTTHFAERTQEARMPLHILLSSPFGDLNENQEEMLGAAQSAVDAVDTEVRQLRKLLLLHRGQLPIVTQPIGVAELLRPPLAIAGARAERARAQLRPTLSDTMPRVVVDAVHAQEALTTILVNAIARTAEGGDLDVDVREIESGRVAMHIVSSRAALAEGTAVAMERGSVDLRLAKWLLIAQHCTVTESANGVTIELPVESTSRVSR